MDGMGLFKKWSDPKFQDVDRLVDTMGNIPPELMLRSFEMLRPTDRWFSYVRLIDNLWDPMFVYGYRIMYKWTNEQIPFPGETFRQFTRELMWENKLMRGVMTVGGKPVNTQAINCPVLNAMAEHDHIAPFASTKPLLSLVGSEDKEDVVLKGGHVSLVAGKNAVGRLWPKVVRVARRALGLADERHRAHGNRYRAPRRASAARSPASWRRAAPTSCSPRATARSLRRWRRSWRRTRGRRW